VNALAIHWLCSIRAIWNAAAAVLRHLLVLTDRLQMQRASAQLLCFLLLCDLENLKHALRRLLPLQKHHIRIAALLTSRSLHSASC